MKKSLLTLALITLVHFSTQAQPTLTAANVATSNFTAEFYFGQATGFNPGSAGANQTWNFSGLALTLGGTNGAIPVAGSPYAALFPTANYLYKFNGLGMERYYYHNLTPAKLEILSMGYANGTGDVYTPNPKTYVEFPYTYNKVFTDTYQATNATTATSFTATYDAYGTLIMPFGTFTNVIRQKVVRNGQTDYNWFNVSPFYPILQTVLAENSLGAIKSATLGIDDSENAKKFAVYPNPTQGEVTLAGSGNFNSDIDVLVYDLLGNLILKKTETFSTGTGYITLNLQNCSAGMYLLKVTDKSGLVVHTQKIIKG